MTSESGGLDIRTHARLDRRLCGEPVEMASGSATVRLMATDDMAADERGLVHGGFLFGLADHAAMLAVNDPHVVLGSGAMRFLAPVTVGETVLASASVSAREGKRATIGVTVHRGADLVAAGDFTCFVLGSHVLDQNR